ncbi:MAG TPA: mechanosensitive ion channel family protein [Terracidiphilus sp.]|nr:mechanosensitive ion channel family protein [Terracidiphilus sp.]
MLHVRAQQPSTSAQPIEAVDLKARGRDILAHLNAVLRLYRAASTPIQRVGEPNDVVYRDQAVTLASKAMTLAFQSAKAETALITAYEQRTGAQSSEQGSGEDQRLIQIQNKLDGQLKDIKAREAALDQQIAARAAHNLAALRAQRQELSQAESLIAAEQDAVEKIIGVSGAHGASALANDIDTLERSVPDLSNNTKTTAVSLTPLDSTSSSGISSQTIKLFDLLSTEHSLDLLVRQNDDLHTQAQNLRTPISKIVHGLLQQGQQLFTQAMQAPPASVALSAKGNKAIKEPPPSAQSGPAENLDDITTDFKAVSAASIPLSEEIVVLEQNRANLEAWRSAVNIEYTGVLHSLLLRLLVMGIALAIIFAAGELWTRATDKYVRETRRRRQLLMLRRTIVGILSAMVLVFGFVTQFNSLATFAGFITAGVAVGLQTILLSVAAYFFIIGKYGIKVGDRVTIASVTGDVIEVGLVRFYLMELAGSGTQLKPSGRVAVFSNAVLFQAGTPLYKQIPGGEFAWHELIVKLKLDTNYKEATDRILKTVNEIYDGYRTTIEKGHSEMERWMQVGAEVPKIESRLQFQGDSVQFWVRYPLQLRRAAEVDEQLTAALLDLIENVPEVKTAVVALPVIQPSVKG